MIKETFNLFGKFMSAFKTFIDLNYSKFIRGI